MILTFEDVRERLAYNPETGVLTWRSLHKLANKRFKVGDPAGHWGGAAPKRLMIELRGKSYFAHRLAWLLYHGEWPSQWVDHIDGNPGNNRINNLRLATQAQNAKNRKVQSTSSTGVKGIEPIRSGFRARIVSDGRLHQLGCYPTMEQAKAAYDAGAVRLHGEFARV